MRHPRFDARLAQRGEHAAERFDLRLCGFLVAERRVQMRIDAGHVDGVHIMIDRRDLLHLLRQKAVAAHAGVDLDVRLGGHARLGREAR